jgi:hypothetical protein
VGLRRFEANLGMVAPFGCEAAVELERIFE